MKLAEEGDFSLTQGGSDEIAFQLQASVVVARRRDAGAFGFSGS